MLYRESGDFKVSYQADQQTFPIKFDRLAFWLAYKRICRNCCRGADDVAFCIFS